MDQGSGVSRISRREFLRAGLTFGAGAAGLAAGYAAVPDVFARGVYAATKAGVRNDRVIVMVQLGGGNDGLQTVIPLASSQYRDLRPQLSRSVDSALPLDGEWGLHASLTNLKSLWDAGKVAIVQGVGYEKPSLSHFDSIRVWETADPSRREQDGWLGRTIAGNYDSAGHPLVGCACGTTSLPGTLRDLEATLTVIRDQRTFRFQGGDDIDRAMGALYTGTPGMYGALFDRSMATARDTVAQLRTTAQRYVPKASYSDNTRLTYASRNQLAAALQLAAELIVSGTGVKVLHVTLGGFDTHVDQADRHGRLLAYFDQAVAAFHQDLAAHGMSDRVLIATWSEFGRRARENASAGTDHGTAAPVILIGDPVVRGLYGKGPDLAKLSARGDLGFEVDFRSVYQEILEGHLRVDAREVFARSFDRVPFLRSQTGSS